MKGLEKILRETFGLEKFRPGQQEIIQSILNCNDTLAVMPTGGGKSLCYQMPALVMPGTAIVISPLIALMKDQVDQLILRRIPSAFINSSLEQDELIEIFENAASDNYKLLYIAPERLASRHFMNLLSNIKLSFIAVDEAHCISEWGHDFRPAYMKIPTIFEAIGKLPTIALTATATKEVRNDIIAQLQMNSPHVFVKGFDRKNLRYECIHTSDKINFITRLYAGTPKGSIIVYAGSRQRTVEFCTALQKIHIPAEFYHGGLKPIQRDSTQLRFISGKTRVIVATNAFGMGIDKHDVRHVIHVDLPQTLEAYYQEAGRAGRDGLDAKCTLLYEPNDMKLQEFFLRTTYPKQTDIKKFATKIEEYNRNIKDNYSDYMIIPEAADIANFAGMPLNTALSIINFLTRLEIIRPGNFASESQIKFTCGEAHIREYYETTTDMRREVLDAILRSVTSDAFRRYCEINLNQLSSKYYISPDKISQGIEALQFAGIIDFRAVRSDTAYYLQHDAFENEAFHTELKKLSIRAKAAKEKLDKMKLYAETLRCKRLFILNYFDDDELTDNCGNCSSCG